MVRIGRDTTINGADLWLTEGKTVDIGEDCMFANNIEIRTGDNHAIFSGGKRINYGKDVIIGSHVWIGANVKLLKGSSIPNGSVVGNSAIVTSALSTPNAVYVGSPARLVKSEIEWLRDKKYRR